MVPRAERTHSHKVLREISITFILAFRAMKNSLKYTFILLLCTACMTGTALADHMFGADLSYTHVSGSLYRVTLKVYRDCNGIPYYDTPISIAPINCAGPTRSRNPPQVSMIDITPVCSSAITRCQPNSTFQYGIEEYTFSDTFDLSNYTGCCKFRISWQQCCRNSTIGTGAADQNFYTEAILDRCVTPGNTSPQITNRPVAIICAGQDFCFNNGILDSIDGDSISFSMAEALQAAGTSVTYSGQYSKNRPLNFLGMPNANASLPAGFHLDSATGDLCFRPVMVQHAEIVIKVTEWRKINGVATNIGETRRDMQFIVTSCPNNKVPNVAGPYAYDACANSKICFDMKSTDADAVDSVRLTWNRGIPAGTFTSSFGHSPSPKKQKGTFCWTPTDDDVSNNPYYFTVSARDDACPINANTTKAYSVTVFPMPRGNRQITKKKCGEVDFTITPLANYGTLNYQWKITRGTQVIASANTSSFSHKFGEPGRYIVHSNLKTSKNCIIDYFDTLDLDTFTSVAIPPDTFICEGQSFNLKAVAKYGHLPYRYIWNTGNANDTLTTLQVSPAATRLYRIQVTDSSGCTNTDSMLLTVRTLPPADIGPDQRICSYQDIELETDSGYYYLWSHQALTTHKITVKDSANYWVRVTDSMGCRNYDTMRLRVNAPVIIAPFGNVGVCLGDTITLTGTGGDYYTWTNLSNNISTTGKTLAISPANTVSYELIAEKTYMGVTCLDIDTFKVTVNYSTPITFPFYPSECADVANIFLSAQPSNGSAGSGAWSCPGCPPNSVTGSSFKPVIAKTGSWNVNYTFTNNFGCVSRDSTTINVLPVAILNAGAARKACLDAGVQKLFGTSSIATGTTNWSCTNCPANSVSKAANDTFYFDPAVAGVGNYNLEYKFTTADNCITTATVAFEVLAIPVVNAGTLNQVCINDLPFDLNSRSGATPAGGSWTGPGVTGSLFYANTAGQGTHKLKYTYQLAGCSREDSVYVSVNLLPTAIAGTDVTLCFPGPVFDLTGSGNGTDNPPGSSWFCQGCPAGNDPVSGFTFNPFIPGTASSQSYALFYKYTDPSTGCSDSDAVTFTVNRKPSLTIPGQGEPLCEGVPFMVRVYHAGTTGITWTSPGGTFTDSTADSTIFKPAATIVQTLVTATADSIPGCPVVKEDLEVNIFPTPTAEIIADNDSGCVPLAVQFSHNTTAVTGATFEWNFGEPGSSLSQAANPSYVFTRAGSWDVSFIVRSINNCYSKPGVKTIVAHPLPAAAFSFDPEYLTIAMPKVRFINNSTGASAYEWRFGDMDNSLSTQPEPVFVYPPDIATYAVELLAVSQFGCRDSAVKTIKISPDILVFIPSAFTPDDQGPERNNAFRIDTEGVTEFSMQIFNRWGQLVFQTNDRFQGWDGSYLQLPCQQDVYLYKVEVMSYDGKPYTYSGTVTLLR
jgi:gliding motility-associated-like protein